MDIVRPRRGLCSRYAVTTGCQESGFKGSRAIVDKVEKEVTARLENVTGSRTAEHLLSLDRKHYAVQLRNTPPHVLLPVAPASAREPTSKDSQGTERRRDEVWNVATELLILRRTIDATERNFEKNYWHR